MKYCRIYIIFIGTTFNFLTFGQIQDLKFHHITVEDGLSQNWVTSIFQDSFGFMWFGTGGNGINKYNSYEFNVYKNDPTNKYTLTNNNITVIYEDNKKGLWVGTSYGLNKYDRENDRFIQITGLRAETITGLYESGDGKLLVIGQSNIYEIKENKAYALFPNSCLNNNANGSLHKDQFGRYWLSTINGGLLQVDIKNKVCNPFLHNDKDLYSLSSNSLLCTYSDKKGNIWFGTWDKGISLMKFKNDSSPYFQNFIHNLYNPNSISDGAVRAIVEDANGNLWVGTENSGLNILDVGNLKKEKFIFRHYRNNPYDITGLKNNSIHCMYKDRLGTIWIGTYAAGINYYNKLLFQFEHYKQVPGEKNSLSNNFINVLFEDDNDLWIGTEGGINILNRKTGKYKVFLHSTNNNKSISTNAIWSFFKDSRGNMWIGTWAGGLNLFDRKSETFIHFRYNIDNPEGLSSDNIFGMIEDNGYLYLATMNGGVCRYDYSTGKFKTYKPVPGVKNSLSNLWITGIYKTKGNEIWVNAVDGVAIFNPVKETFTNFMHDTANAKSISYPLTNAMFEDSKYNLWFATDGGLNLFIRKDSSFKYYREEDGLPDNAIKSICEDKHGNLWLGTNNGLSKFINAVNLPEKPVFKNYSKNDGLQGNEFGRKSCLLGNDGKLYFGGNNGFNAFYPDSIKDNPYVPEIVITDFLLFNKHVEIGAKNSPLKKSIGSTKELVLNYNQYVLTFSYAALNYMFPEKNQYKYILEGFEKEWNNVGNKREATYTNLPPGKYTFRVIGSNNNNVWNQKGASIKIVILPPWWNTWWFKIAILLLLVTLIFIAYYLRVAAYRKKQKELSILVQRRTQEISKANQALMERQARIEEQSEELKTHTENLKEANELLLEKQKVIEAQTSLMIENNEELKRLNSTKDKLFSIIAHDLRNPFHSVIGFSELLKDKLEQLPIEKTKKFIDLIYKVSSGGHDLLENLLQWSRTQTGTIKFEPAYISPALVANDVLNLLEGSALTKFIKFQQLIDPDIYIYADENMLKTIFRNLITNAIKFSNENGAITLSLSVNGKYAEIAVTDTGIGIPEENIPLLFRIETNITTKGTSNETGTGLGLLICKEFVERHDGKIWVESAPGKGSTFKFTLPLQ